MYSVQPKPSVNRRVSTSLPENNPRGVRVVPSARWNPVARRGRSKKDVYVAKLVFHRSMC